MYQSFVEIGYQISNMYYLMSRKKCFVLEF